MDLIICFFITGHMRNYHKARWSSNYRLEMMSLSSVRLSVMPEPGGPGGPLARRSVNPIPTMGGRFCPPFTSGTPNVFHLPASLLYVCRIDKFTLTILQIISSCLFEAFAPVFLWLVEISPHKFHGLELGMNFVPSFFWVLSKKCFCACFIVFVCTL